MVDAALDLVYEFQSREAVLLHSRHGGKLKQSKEMLKCLKMQMPFVL